MQTELADFGYFVSSSFAWGITGVAPQHPMVGTGLSSAILAMPMRCFVFVGSDTLFLIRKFLGNFSTGCLKTKEVDKFVYIYF